MKVLIIFLLCFTVFSFVSCGKTDTTAKVGDSTQAVTTTAAVPTGAPAIAEANNTHKAIFNATFDGKPIEVGENNRWTGVVMGGIANDGKSKISTVNITTHGKNNSDYLVSFDFMGGKTGTTSNASAIVNVPGESFGGKRGGKSIVTVTKAESIDDKHTLYSGQFEIECAKIAMGDAHPYVLKGTFENYEVLVSSAAMKAIGNALSTGMKK